MTFQLKHRFKTSLAGSALLLSLGRAQADDGGVNVTALRSMSLEDLGDLRVYTVVAASKYEQKTTEAPASVSVITHEEIQRYGFRTLADILNSLQGFNVSLDRNYAYLGVRGLSLGDDNSRVLLLIDGHRMNNNLTDSAFVGDEFLLDVDLIDHVEVIRGPGSVLYGNNALFAVINVVTRKGGQINGVEASGEYGSFDSYKVRFTAGKAFTNGVEFLLSGTYYNSNGPKNLFYDEYNTPAQNNGVAQYMDGDSYASLFSSVSYKSFIIEGGLMSRDKTDPTAQNFTTFDDPRSRTVNDRSYVDLKYTNDIPRFADLTARIYYDRTDTKTGYPFSTSPGGEPYFVENSSGECWGVELQLNRKIGEKSMVSAGAEFRDDFRESDQVVDPTGTYTSLTDLHTSRLDGGIYAEGDFALRNNLHLEGGARYDQYGSYGPFYSPRVALVYNPLEQSVFKAIYGTAFRAPNFQELAGSPDHSLQAEDITTYELIYEQGIGPHLRSSLSGYYNQLDDLIIYQDGAYMNVDADSRGLELGLEGNWPHDIRCRASYSLQRTENHSNGADFPDSPESLVKLTVSAPVFTPKLMAGLEFNYVSSRHSVFTDPSGGATLPGSVAPGYSVVNFTLFSKDIIKNVDISAGVYNLLNQSYSDPATAGHLQDLIPQDGRTFRLKITCRF